MEDRRPSRDESQSWQANSATERPEFLARWFQRRHELASGNAPETASDEEEDDDETDTSLPKRFRRMFRRMFRRIVEPVTEGSVADVQPIRSGLGEFMLGFDRAEPIPVQHERSPRISHAPESDEPIQPRAPEAVNVGPLNTWEVQIPQEQRIQSNIETTQHTLTPETVPSISPEHTPERPAADRHEIKNAPGATLALLGAEFFARRRADRKIERKMNRQIKSLAGQVEKGKHAQIRLEQLIPAQPNIVERLVQQKNSERRPEAAPRPHVKYEGQLKVPRAETITTTGKLIEKHVEPNILMERVAEAAEHNQPLERAYERRQEIKDEPGTPVAGAGASAVGDILSRKTVIQTTMNQPSDITNTQNQKAAVKISQKSGVYRSAVLGGLWSALVILVLAAIAYLTVR